MLRQLALDIMDVDWFKAYNDLYGHPAGDACLRQIAQTLAATLARSADFFARYGGEEFVLVAPSTRAADLGAVVQRLMRDVRQLEVPHEGEGICFTFSCGLADSTELALDKVTPEALLGLVDQRLYEAKDAGRDRCVGPADCWPCEPTRLPVPG